MVIYKYDFKTKKIKYNKNISFTDSKNNEHEKGRYTQRHMRDEKTELFKDIEEGGAQYV